MPASFFSDGVYVRWRAEAVKRSRERSADRSRSRAGPVAAGIPQGDPLFGLVSELQGNDPTVPDRGRATNAAAQNRIGVRMLSLCV